MAGSIPSPGWDYTFRPSDPMSKPPSDTESRLIPIDVPEHFEPRTYEFESVAVGLKPCPCPHCGEDVLYVAVLAPKVVICPTCEGEIPCVEPPPRGLTV